VCEILFPLGKTAAKTVMMLKAAFKDEAMGITQVYEWFNHFKRGKMSVEGQLHCGHPSTNRNNQNLEKVHQAVLSDRHQTIHEISEITGVSWSSCQRILTEDLTMKQAAANFMPCLLTEEQKNNHVNVCHDLHEEHKNDPQFLIEIVTGNESWCYGYDPESSHWKSQNSPRPKKKSTASLLKCQDNVDFYV
jgi:hypothetical protein